MAPVNEKEQDAGNEREGSRASSSTTNNLTNGSAATPSSTSTSTASTAESTGAKTASSSSFLAAAAAEERQQPGGVSSGSNAMLTAAGQAVDEVTASSVAAISSKLQQVRGYITQTSAAMVGLEQQADMSKIGQYNTLVKVLRELKTSEAKLAAHLATLQAASTGSAAPATAAPSATTAPSAPPPAIADVPNSQSIGQVSTRTVDAVDDVDRRTPSATPSFADRLAAGMEEANQLTNRLRDNVARREDLVERYRATRERLSALKRQRRDIQQQERSLLLSQTTRESPYEDPIPGASSWSLEELNTGLADFRSLYDKVATLKNAYDIKAQALEVGDAAGRAELDNKMEQLATKRNQLIAVITQLKRLRAEKMREQGMDADGDVDDFQVSPTATTSSSTSTTAVTSSSAAVPATRGPSTSTSVSTRSSSVSTISTSVSTGSTSISTSARPTVTRSDSAADFSDLLPADPVSESRAGGGSVSIGTLPALVSAANMDAPPDADEGVSGGVTESALTAVVTARAEMEAAGQELVLRTQHLNNLKEELASMKRLLDVTQQRQSQSVAAADDGAAEGAGEGDETEGGDGAEVEVAEEYITGVSGNVIHLSDTERHDPAVVAKFRELSAAKQRMAQMEEIMQRISASRGTGLPLTHVLTPLQLRLLQQAEAEEDQSGEASRRRAGGREGVRARSPPASQSPARPTARGGDGEDGGGDQGGGGGGGWSALLNKTTTTGHPANDEASHTRSKLAPDKQGAWSNTTPQQHQQRLFTISSLQEELRRKKNALEDLMRGMGKQSAPHADNLSDNAALPAGEEDFEDSTTAPRLSRPSGALEVSGSGSPLSAPVSAEGLSVRPKHNIGGSAADAPQHAEGADGGAAHGALAEALQQLRAVQGTINNLHDSLTAGRNNQLQQQQNQESQQPLQEQQSLLQQPLPQRHQQSLSQSQHLLSQPLQQTLLQPQQHPLQQLQLLQHQLPSHSIAATPQLSLPDPALGQLLSSTAPGLLEGSTATSGLQQCFSQLYLHSLEIQALNKQLQVRHQQQMMQLYQQQLLQHLYRSAYSTYVDPLMLPLQHVHPSLALPPASFAPPAPFSLSPASFSLPPAPLPFSPAPLPFSPAPLPLPPASFSFPSAPLSLPPSTSTASTSLPVVDAAGFAVYGGLISAPSTSTATVNSSGLPSVNPSQLPRY